MDGGTDHAGGGPSLREVARGPAALVVTHAYRWFVWSTRCRSASADVEGGLEAGQAGMVALQARAALEAAIDVHLAMRGRFFVPDAHRWEVFADVCGEDSALYREAWTLDGENPQTSADVLHYAERCRRFVEDDLGVRPPASRDTPEDLATFDRTLAEIAALAASLGVDSPLSGTRHAAPR